MNDKLSDKKPLNFHRECCFNIFLLKINGLYPIDGFFGNCFFNVILVILVNISHLFIITMDAIDVVYDTQIGIIDIEVIAGCIGLSGLYVRFVIFCYRRAEVFALFKESEKLWNQLKESEKCIVSKYMRFMKTLTRIYLISYILALLMYVATNIMLASSISINGIPHKHLMFGKTVYVRKPFFEIISVLEILSAGVMTTSSGYDMAAPFIITMAAGYFKTLYYRYENAQKQHSFNNDDQMFKDIIACIIYHQKIDRFCTNINKFTKSLFLIQLISSTYNLSILLLVVILNPKEDLKNGPIIIVQALQFFLCHWTSDVLLSESLDIRKSVYMIPSVNRKDTKLSKVIQILLMKLQNPVQLTAGGFINLSVECFGNMMSSVVSFFLVIHSFTNH